MTDRKQALTDLMERVEEGNAGFYSFDSFFYTPYQDMALEQCAADATKAYNGSLDAAKALHEAVLPESWHYDIDSEEGGVCVFQVGLNTAEIGNHNNPARAWLIAILKALIAQED